MSPRTMFEDPGWYKTGLYKKRGLRNPPEEIAAKYGRGATPTDQLAF